MTILRIALMIGTDGGFGCRLLKGVHNYARPSKPWMFRNALAQVRSVPLIAGWKPAGLITAYLDEKLARAIKGLNIPVAALSNTLEKSEFPRVGVDDMAVGRLAAEYYLERGFLNFGFVGVSQRHPWVRQRESGFLERLRREGCACSCFADPSPSVSVSWAKQDSRLRNWLRLLPKPAGIFACNDQRASEIAEVCHGAGIHVPEQVALLGVDNDELLCGLAHPPLSSVDAPLERIGYEAAALLDRMLRPGTSAAPAPAPILFAPDRVVTRQSSDVLAIEDGVVASALRFIRECADKPIVVEHIVERVAVSRRSLERRFRGALGRTLSEEIRRIHVERAKELLARTDLAMPEIARRTGFQSAERLSVVFRRIAGEPPTVYRKQSRPAQVSSAAFEERRS